MNRSFARKLFVPRGGVGGIELANPSFAWFVGGAVVGGLIAYAGIRFTVVDTLKDKISALNKKYEHAPRSS